MDGNADRTRGFASFESFEYTDYEKSKTKGAASEFITRAIEDKVDLIGKRENYVGYITMRPHVEKTGSHGLFTDSTEGLSLRREDAARLGYDKGSAWRDLLRSQTKEMAEAMKIPLTDLRWYEQREQVIRTYADAMPERIPLSQNKEFKSVRNAIIQEAIFLSDGQISSDQPLDDPENPNATPSPEPNHPAGEGTTAAGISRKNSGRRSRRKWNCTVRKWDEKCLRNIVPQAFFRDYRKSSEWLPMRFKSRTNTSSNIS